MLELRAGYVYVDGLGLDTLILGFSLLDVDVSGDSALEADLGELEVVEVGGDGGIEQLLLRIEAAELEVVHGQLGADTQLDVGEIGGTGLSVGAGLLDGAADLSPEIGLPEHLTGYGVRAKGQSFGGARRLIGSVLARDGGSGAERGVVVRAGDKDLLSGLKVLLIGGLECLVGDGDFVFKVVEPGIVVDPPPLALEVGVAGLRLLPGSIGGIWRRQLLESGRWWRHGWALVVWAYGAAGDGYAHKSSSEQKAGIWPCEAHIYLPPPGCCGSPV